MIHEDIYFFNLINIWQIDLGSHGYIYVNKSVVYYNILVDFILLYFYVHK